MENGLYVVTEGTNAWLSAKVIQSVDLGTHTLFLADVEDGAVLLRRHPRLTRTIRVTSSRSRNRPKRPDGDAGSVDIFMKERSFRLISCVRFANMARQILRKI